PPSGFQSSSSNPSPSPFVDPSMQMAAAPSFNAIPAPSEEYEISWAKSSKPVSAAEVLGVVEVSIGALPQSVKLGRNFIVVGISSAVQGFETRIADALEHKVQVKRIAKPVEQPAQQQRMMQPQAPLPPALPNQ